jgi:hypothetical protein
LLVAASVAEQESANHGGALLRFVHSGGVEVDRRDFCFELIACTNVASTLGPRSFHPVVARPQTVSIRMSDLVASVFGDS